MKGSSEDSCSNIKILLRETIMALCRNGLSYNSKFSVEGLLGITLDEDDVFLVSIKENVVRETLEGEKRSTPDKEMTYLNSDITIQEKNGRKRRKRSRVQYEKVKSETYTIDDSGNEEVGSVDSTKPGFRIDNDTPLASDSFPTQEITNQISKRYQGVPTKRPKLSMPNMYGDNPLAYTIKQRGTIRLSEQVDPQIAMGGWRNAGQRLKETRHHAQYPRSLLKGRGAQLVPHTSTSLSNPYTPLKAAVLEGRTAAFQQKVSETAVLMTHEEDVALSRCILGTSGCFVSARSVQRKTHRWNSEQIMQGMIKLTRAKDDPLYVGEFKLVRSTVKVFYKCPPELIRDEALYRYEIPKLQYEMLFIDTARPTSSAPNAWESYLEGILSVSPFAESMALLPEFKNIMYSGKAMAFPDSPFQIKSELQDFDSPFTNSQDDGTEGGLSEVTLEATAPEDVPPVEQTITLETTPYHQSYEKDVSQIQLNIQSDVDKAAEGT